MPRRRASFGGGEGVPTDIDRSHPSARAPSPRPRAPLVQLQWASVVAVLALLLFLAGPVIEAYLGAAPYCLRPPYLTFSRALRKLLPPPPRCGRTPALPSGRKKREHGKMREKRGGKNGEKRSGEGWHTENGKWASFLRTEQALLAPPPPSSTTLMPAQRGTKP